MALFWLPDCGFSSELFNLFSPFGPRRPSRRPFPTTLVEHRSNTVIPVIHQRPLLSHPCEKMEVAVLTNDELLTIERRHKERKEFFDHIPSGPYLYDSFAFVHNDFSLSPERPKQQPRKRVGILIRRQDWFDPIDMDANLGDRKVKREYLRPCSDLGQYIALACTHPVEEDFAALLAEVKRLRKS